MDAPSEGSWEQEYGPAGKPLGRLVAAQFHYVDNRPTPEFDLWLSLGFDQTFVDGIGVRYRVRLRQCIVELETNGCYKKAYSYVFPHEVASEDIKSTIEGSVHGKFEAGGKGSKLMSLFSAKASLEGQRSTKRERHQKRDIPLISCHVDHWIVGDPELGHPGNPDGCLYGRYFQEKPDTPLCQIKVRKESPKAEIIAKLIACFGYLNVEIESPGGKLHTARSSEATAISDAIKSRLRGIRLLKAQREESEYMATNELSNRVGTRLPEREFTLLTLKLTANMPVETSMKDVSQINPESPSKHRIERTSRMGRSDDE